MRRQTLTLGTILVFFGLLIALTGCRPDLVPANPNNMAAFCDGPDRTILWVYVKNQGGDDAPASHTSVEFYYGGTGDKVVKETPPIEEGDTQKLDFPIPSSCWDPDCGFKITVDCYEEVNESDEGNNSVDGNCIG